MKKYKFTVLFSLILIIIAFYVYNVKAYSNNFEPYVNFYIQGYDKTIGYSKVQAYTFIEALKKTTKEKNIDIMLQQDKDKVQIYAIDGVANNKFSASDGWYGYIVRDNAIIEQDDYLNLQLKNGDDVILYYGNLSKTEKIVDIYGDIDKYISGDNILFKIESQYTQWEEKNGEWKPSYKGKIVEGVKIHVTTPKNNTQEVITDVNGQAIVKFDGTGVYSYYAEGYEDNDVPIIVRTKNYYSVYGVNSENKLTRAEAVSLLVNHCKLENQNISEKYKNEKYKFEDISNNIHYNEINIAVSNGIINGYSDNSFKPDNNITFLELAIMLHNIYGKEYTVEDIAIENVPEWAKRSVAFATHNGFFNGININWDNNVSSNDILKLYFNLKEKGMI